MTRDVPVPQAEACAFALPGMILVLAPALGAAEREAVIDTMLLAALAATRQGGDGEARRATLLHVLAKVGWTTAGFQAARYVAPSTSLTLGQAIVTAAEQVAGPDGLAPLAAAVERAPVDGPASGMLGRGEGDAGAFEVTVALAREQDAALVLRLVVLRADLAVADIRSERRLDFRAIVESTDVQVSTTRLLLQPAIYRAVAASVHEKVHATAAGLLPLIEARAAGQA